MNLREMGIEECMKRGVVWEKFNRDDAQHRLVELPLSSGCSISLLHLSPPGLFHVSSQFRASGNKSIVAILVDSVLSSSGRSPKAIPVGGSRGERDRDATSLRREEGFGSGDCAAATGCWSEEGVGDGIEAGTRPRCLCAPP